MSKIPDFKIISTNGPIPDDMIMDREGFYTHMMDFVVAGIYDGPSNEILCRFIDEDNNAYTSTLTYDGYKQSLSRCLEYFEETEEFERCVIIKKILNERL